MLVDVHCHLEDPAFNADREEVIARAKRALDFVVCSIVDPKDYELGLEIVRKHPDFVKLTLAIHPGLINNFTDLEIDSAVQQVGKYYHSYSPPVIPEPNPPAGGFRHRESALVGIGETGLDYNLFRHSRVAVRGWNPNLSKCRALRHRESTIVAIGETGLDYNWVKKESERERQKDLFIKSIRLAKKLDLPLVVHIRAGKDKKAVPRSDSPEGESGSGERDPYLETIEILEKEGAKKVLLHMFGAKRFLQRVLDNGWHISTNAIVLTGKEHNRIVRAVPLDRLLLETDSPYLVPEPEKLKGIKRNEPAFVKYVAERVARIKEMDFEKVVGATTQNAKKFFAM